MNYFLAFYCELEGNRFKEKNTDNESLFNNWWKKLNFLILKK